MEEEIYGYIDQILFCDLEKGFTVAKLKEPKKSELACLVGCLPSVQPGETIRCKGAWKHHPHHGKQFEVSSFELQAPSDLVGIQKYLESGMIKGIGRIYAEKIVKKFGLGTLQIIDEDPKRLLEIPGIGEKRIEKIQSCWEEQKAIREVMVFLRGHGVSPSYAQKIFKAYREKSIEKVRSNPYALAKEISGIGFKSADKIAQGVGIPHNSPYRIEAGIEYVLWELSNEGHVCYPEKELLVEVEKALELPPLLLEEHVEELRKRGDLFKEGDLVWMRPLYLAEMGIARELARLFHAPCNIRFAHEEKAIGWVQEQLKLELAKEQKEAVIQGVREKITLITGGPGTGKSTITKAILAITEKLTQKIVLAAPTGKAAKRMSEITRKKAGTIHSLLEMDFAKGGFKRNKENPISCDLLIVDEASMIDTLLMNHLLKAIPTESRVIFIGDIDQLPSVGPGNVLKDMIFSSCLPLTHLKQIFRQAAQSRIVINAHQINQGNFPDLSPQKESDFHFLSSESPEEILNTVIDLVKTRLPNAYRFHSLDEIQVLSPMKRGIIGTENLNSELQKSLNPSKAPLLRLGRCFHLGDKVMQIRNNYQKEVYNGDVGKIIEIDFSEQVLYVAFEGKIIEYDFKESDELLLAYAVSIHKYQGSECPCIIIPLHTSHFKLLYRNLLYTGITRARKLVVIVGSKKALAMAVKNEEVRKRYTGLEMRLKECLS